MFGVASSSGKGLLGSWIHLAVIMFFCAVVGHDVRSFYQFRSVFLWKWAWNSHIARFLRNKFRTVERSFINFPRRMSSRWPLPLTNIQIKHWQFFQERLIRLIKLNFPIATPRRTRYRTCFQTSTILLRHITWLKIHVGFCWHNCMIGVNKSLRISWWISVVGWCGATWVKTAGSDPSLDLLYYISDVFGDDQFMSVGITVNELPDRWEGKIMQPR